MTRRTLLALSLLAVMSVPSATMAEYARLTLESDPGDFVGGGQTKDITYTPQNSDLFDSDILTGRNVNGEPAFLRFALGTVTGSNSTNTLATLDFSTERLGIPFQVGTYGLPGNTASDPFFPPVAQAGLYVSFQNRAPTAQTGNFIVNSVRFYRDARGELQVGYLDVNFEQHNRGLEPALRGRLIFQGQAVPEPSSLVLLGLGAGALALAHGRRKSFRSRTSGDGVEANSRRPRS